MKKIAVFCGASSGINPIYKKSAEKVGAYFGENNIGLVYGGGKIGLMGVLADELLKHDGHVIGIIPHLLVHNEVVHSELSELIETKTMSKRKIKISKLVDGYIALAGGFGTLDEIFEALTLGQLGIEHKPIGILNTNHFFDPLLNQLDLMVKEGFLKQENRDMILVHDSIETLVEQMYTYKPVKITSIINTVAK